MLHAPTSETKTETTQSKSQLAPQPGRELHPHAFSASGIYALNGAGSAASIPPGAQRHQIFAGMQATHGNQAVLRMLQSPQRVAQLSALRPSQGVMLQRKCACGDPSEMEGECAECKEKREAGVIQTKLAINQPGDEYELEADRIAERVMVMADLEPPASDDQDEARNSLMRKQSSQAEIHVATQSRDVPPSVHSVLNSGGGQPLDTTTREFMEPRFGHDFSQVRVHTDEQAAESAQAVNALAYTLGQDVVFGSGRYRPGTNEGNRLLAHELTHVVQQTNAIQRQPTPTAKKPLTQQEGGIANVTDLEQDMRDVLILWRGDAIDGVNLFATTALSERIDDLTSASWESFITAMIGNTIWAAAAFTPVGASTEAFAVSMAGVTVAAIPGIPSKSKSAIPTVQKIMQDYIYSVHRQLNVRLRNNAQLLIKSDPGITRYRALGKFVKESFKLNLYTINEGYGGYPTLNDKEIRNLYEQVATDYMRQIVPIGEQSFTGGRGTYKFEDKGVYWVVSADGTKKLALLEKTRQGIVGPGTGFIEYKFIEWISTDFQQNAIDQHKAHYGVDPGFISRSDIVGL